MERFAPWGTGTLVLAPRYDSAEMNPVPSLIHFLVLTKLAVQPINVEQKALNLLKTSLNLIPNPAWTGPGAVLTHVGLSRDTSCLFSSALA